MKQREIMQTGLINNQGKLLMHQEELNEFFRHNPNKRVIAKFTLVDVGSSQALRAYYFNVVVPKFRRALYDAGERLTEQQAELRMREMSPIMCEEYPNYQTGKYMVRTKAISEIGNAELIEHIDTIKQICAEEYSVYIEDPRNI